MINRGREKREKMRQGGEGEKEPLISLFDLCAVWGAAKNEKSNNCHTIAGHR